MALVIEDRAGREPTRTITDKVKIAAETRRIASILNRPAEEVREELVCGLTLRTAGYLYTLTD